MPGAAIVGIKPLVTVTVWISIFDALSKALSAFIKSTTNFFTLLHSRFNTELTTEAGLMAETCISPIDNTRSIPAFEKCLSRQIERHW